MSLCLLILRVYCNKKIKSVVQDYKLQLKSESWHSLVNKFSFPFTPPPPFVNYRGLSLFSVNIEFFKSVYTSIYKTH